MSTINVSWLPQYHDMGLIGSYLGSCGAAARLLVTEICGTARVVVEAISQVRGTRTQARILRMRS